MRFHHYASHFKDATYFLYSNFMSNSHDMEHVLGSDQLSEYNGALLAFHFPLNLRGSNSFVGNIGGGIVLLATRINLMGNLLLKGNEAINGGGISMDDTCLVSKPSSKSTVTERNSIIVN